MILSERQPMWLPMTQRAPLWLPMTQRAPLWLPMTQRAPLWLQKCPLIADHQGWRQRTGQSQGDRRLSGERRGSLQGHTPWEQGRWEWGVEDWCQLRGASAAGIGRRAMLPPVPLLPHVPSLSSVPLPPVSLLLTHPPPVLQLAQLARELRALAEGRHRRGPGTPRRGRGRGCIRGLCWGYVYSRGGARPYLHEGICMKVSA